MAKHDQQWRDARWKQKERQKVAEKKRRDWETSEQEQQTKHLLRELRKFTGWAESLNGDFSFLKEIGPGVDFSKILEGTPCRFVSQKWNGDGTYDVTFEVDILSNNSSHERVGVLTATAFSVSYTAGRLEVHGRCLKI